MAYGTMTLQELAQMLGADLRRVERMVQRGEIPSQKVSGQTRLHRVQIQQWLHCEMGAMESGHLDDLDSGMTNARQVAPDEVLLTPLLRSEAIRTNLGAKTKSSALRRLVALADETGLVWDREALLEGVLKREEMGSTALPEGVAIPHPIRPLPYGLAEPVVVVARTEQPLVFGTDYGKTTQLFFLTACQEATQHLHVLARLCRMLRDESWIEAMLEAESPRAMLELLIQREADLIRSV